MYVRLSSLPLLLPLVACDEIPQACTWLLLLPPKYRSCTVAPVVLEFCTRAYYFTCCNTFFNERKVSFTVGTAYSTHSNEYFSKYQLVFPHLTEVFTDCSVHCKCMIYIACHHLGSPWCKIHELFCTHGKGSNTQWIQSWYMIESILHSIPYHV